MKKLFLTLYLLSSTILYAKIEVLDRIAVIVDDGVIMESQITKTLADVSKRYDDQNIPPPPADILLEQVTEKLIIEELQLQMADRAGVRISDAELNLTLSRLAANNQLSLEEFVVFVEENGDSYEDLREQMRREMRIQRIQRGRVNSSIDITEKEFESFLATDETLSALDPELLVRQILVKNLSTANEIIELLDNGSDFAEIAKEKSISSNAQTGGLLNWRKAVDMPELFEKALVDQSIGFISEPLESGSGYHILKLEDKRGEFVQFEDQWQSRHILLIPSAIRTEDDTELELNNLRQRVIDGESFESLAKEFSEDPGSALQGGDLGWLGLGVLAEEFEATMLEMEIGEISPVFQTEFGFHFLEVLAKRSHELTDDLIKDRAYSILYARKFDEELENTLRSMRAEAFVEFKDLD
jgi:peptidyl-prolyl cis-trans isomerase SurA|tara:strand:+ start:401 stop:1642 length:1242 start_codon:yes stop_codon:yes gene_type:complete